MDFVAQSGINITCSVLVSSVNNTCTDDEIVDILRAYGSLKTVLFVTDPKSSFYKNLIAEFEDANAFSDIKPLLPYKCTSQTTADRVYSVTALSSEYVATAGGSLPTPTPDYIHNFKEMAERSGVRFEDVLKTVMNQIHQHLKTSGANDETDNENEDNEEDIEEEEEKVDILNTAQPVSKSETPQSVPQPSLAPPRQSVTDPRGARPKQSHRTHPSGIGTGFTQRVSLSQQDLNPPEIQRVVVEHVVRNTDLSASASPRLRSFSGRIPKPSNEADYESWRSQIDLLLADPSLSALHVTRRIMESLLTPAADLVKGLGPDTVPIVLLRVLDSAFGTAQDGEELNAQYLSLLQNPGERPSSYLQRLQLMLTTVVKRRGIPAAEMNKHLLRQFLRGCWDNTIITKLQLEQQKSSPPPFSELLLLLRTEEDRQQAKDSLMKKHIGSGSSKQRVNIQSQSACSCGHTSSSSDELKELKEQMRQLQRQMSAFLSSQKSPAESKSAPRTSSRLSSSSATKPKPWYCFTCGEDGHISSACTNAANPSLVEKKKKQLRQNQQAWTAKTTQSN